MADRSGKKRRKCEPSGPLGQLHEDMLERVLARLPPAAFFRLRGVCRRWSDASRSPSFLAACARAPARDPWFLMLSDSELPRSAAVAFEAGEGAWAWARRADAAIPEPEPVPVAAAGGLLLYRAPDTGALTVANPLTGASRSLPPPPLAPPGARLHAVAMYGESPYHVVLILGELPDTLSMAKFDSSTNAWEDIAPLSRTKPDSSLPADADAGDEDEDHEDGVGGDGNVYFLSKMGDIMASTVQRSASRQHYAAVTLNGSRGWDPEPVAHFLTDSGAVVACDISRRVFAELPRVLPASFEYSLDVVACGGGGGARALVVVLSELMETASLRVWEFVGGDGEWRQVAAMPPAMSHAFYGKKADVNCVGHGGRVMVCVSSSSVGGGVGEGESSGCFVCDLGSNRWEELPRCGAGAEGEVADFVAAFSFEPRMEATV